MYNTKRTIDNTKEMLEFDIGDYIFAPNTFTTKKLITGFYVDDKDYTSKNLSLISGLIASSNTQPLMMTRCGFIIYNEFTKEEEYCHFVNCLPKGVFPD